MATNSELLDLYAHMRRLISLKANAVLRDTGFGLRQFIILRTLSQFPAVSVTELVERTMTDAGTVSRSIQQLAKCGYVEKKQCERDGRISYVQLTRKGEKIVPALDRLFDRLADHCFSALKPGDRAQFGHLLHAVIENLERVSIEREIEI
jgi:MarR family transcriptional regulator, 2-MHQ and catechol-resistance regulon repressor